MSAAATSRSAVSVLIPHAGDAERLERCLSSLQDASIAAIHVVMPEAARRSRDLVSGHAKGSAIVTDHLLTFAQATNLAARQADTPFLLLLNDDTWAQPGAVELLVDALRADEQVGAVGAHLLNPDGSTQYSACGDPSWAALAELACQPILRRTPVAERLRFPYRREPRALQAPEWVSGAALLIGRDLYDEVGSLDESFPHGLEDAALCLEVRRTGFRVAVVDGAHIFHEGGASGWRHASDPEKVACALLRGAEGWRHYWRRYRGAGRTQLAMLEIAFAATAMTRIVGFWLLTCRHSGESGPRLKLEAHWLYARGLRERA